MPLCEDSKTKSLQNLLLWRSPVVRPIERASSVQQAFRSDSFGCSASITRICEVDQRIKAWCRWTRHGLRGHRRLVYRINRTQINGYLPQQRSLNMPCTDGTCIIHERVHNCGHYEKSLEKACKEAKKKQRVCEAGTTTVSKTTGLKGCSLPNCDKKAGIKRDGPGWCLISWVATVLISNRQSKERRL